MKLTTTVLVLTLAATASAQSVQAPINAAKKAANVSSSQAAATNKALPAQQPAPAKADPFVSKPAAKALVVANAPKPPAATATKTAANEPAPEEKKKSLLSSGAKRDPFVSIIRTDKTGGANPCVTGKKCLVIGDIVLRGIVKSPNAIIAVVENNQKKTYFLHESDPVFNGQVVKITADAIVFREQVTDRVGKVSSREITKHLNTRPIA